VKATLSSVKVFRSLIKRVMWIDRTGGFAFGHWAELTTCVSRRGIRKIGRTRIAGCRSGHYVRPSKNRSSSPWDLSFRVFLGTPE